MIDIHQKNVRASSPILSPNLYFYAESTQGDSQVDDKDSSRNMDAIFSLIQAHPENETLTDAKATLTEEEFNSALCQYHINHLLTPFHSCWLQSSSTNR